MKITCVCGLGMGSSLILKMTVEKAMQELGIECDVEHQAAGTMSGISSDIILASFGFEDELAEYNNTIFVKNIVSVEESKKKLEAYLNGDGSAQ